jgi:glycosyltransferase involved in cell wall biosynthesis
VFEQSYDPIEYIVVDDGSTDGTRAVVEGFDYADVQYIKLDENHGVSTARNEGIEAANGRFVLFVDADDELRESAVATLVAELTDAPEDCAGVFGRVLHRYEGSKTVRQSASDRSEIRYEDLIEENPMGALGGKLLRRRLFDEVGHLDPTLPSSEDFDFFLRAASNGYRFGYVDEPTYVKHHHDEQLYADTHEKITGMRRVLEKHGDELTPRHRAYRMQVIGHTYAKKDRMAEACDWFENCISLFPLRPHYYVRFVLSKLRLYNRASDAMSAVRSRVG